ncbi:T9SS type A sorting domain-containing protein [Hymenobacter weizhouensis]|uniref:T9SS type A sorting domain-containing protein n=1 Tax=Hymenobacter sp. YIM 151500-1 TaxID=2987689 RepID=UPI00222734CF|nr:T9SS type A sorting domain-containing protein [Hymenobacter sp. YIM 151500-1]UYZ64613.1 T9SS type A sorting domain-containing protein [Hymenobacter sp. YIM 151500-1]
MKKLFTLAAAGALTAASLGVKAQTQAPITVNGQLAASEVGVTGYQLVGRFTGPRGFGDAGLLALYAASDANNLYFFVAGTLQTGPDLKNSIQLFIDRPGVDGVPVGTALPAVTTPTGTSFNGMTARLDLAADLAVAIKGTNAANEARIEGVAYTSATAATAQVLTGTTPLALNGTAATVPASSVSGALAGFAGAQVAYTTSANLSSNPGFSTNGNAPSNGLEISVSRTAMGIPAVGGTVRIFAVQNNQDGDFLSTDFIPQSNPPATAATNLGAASSVNFANIPGTQAGTLVVTATTLTVLGNRKTDDARIAFRAYPNPLVDSNLKLDYTVADRAQPVTITVSDMVGRAVRTISRDKAAVGQHTAQIERTGLTAGTYMVRVQVGESASARKVVIF